jgi:hypothetical protein
MKYAVIDQKRDVYAVASSVHSLRPKVAQAEAYLEEARTCGHPLAKRWVEERLPIEIVEVGDDEETSLSARIPTRVPILERLDVSSPILEREA